MNFLRAEHISKSYGERVLFTDLELTIDKGERIALIAQNGSGKTSLLNILTGRDIPDSGSVIIDKNISWAYLEQEPVFEENRTLIDIIFSSDNEILRAVAVYEQALESMHTGDASANAALQEAMEKMDAMQAWDIEAKVKTILTKLNLDHHVNQAVNTLSGGQKKRLALARLLMQNPDLMILDEPTNHLDIQMIEWLEGYLKVNDTSLLLVTHDRYFLDNICNEIIELDNGQLHTYRGNYAYFLEKRAMRESFEAAELDAARKLMRKELEWMRRQPKARTTKAKSRIDAFYEVKEKASKKKADDKVEMAMQMQRLGSKILEVHHLKKSFGETKICNDFTYLFKPAERIGVIGNNGTGKTTFLNMLLGRERPDSGRVIKGDTVKFGYYSQDGLQINDEKRVIEVITDIAEYIEVGKGKKLSATALLRQFLFDSKKQYNYVSTLSGGEKRRLYLLTVLMQKPNFLVLDEPTNDLDIQTLNVLEEFLSEFEGCLITVTHDRYFMDNLVDSLFIFEGDGEIRSFNGNYQEYLNELDERKEEKGKAVVPSKEVKRPVEEPSSAKKKLSYKEQRELDMLDKEIVELHQRKKELESLLNAGSTDHEALMNWGKELEETGEKLNAKELRWLELSEV